MIEGKKIMLRLFTENDIESFYSYLNKLADIGDFSPVRLVSKSTLIAQYEKDGFWSDDIMRLAIVTNQGKLAGFINGFRGSLYMPAYEIGYLIFKEEDRGKGYGSEALQLFVDYLFESKVIPRLQICYCPDNIASKRIAEKVGFKLEGILRQALFHKGQYRDLEITSLIRDDWEERRNKREKERFS